MSRMDLNIQEERTTSILSERDDAIVSLSKSIAAAITAKENNYIDLKVITDFKNSFIRLTNLTSHYDKLIGVKYKDKYDLLKMIEAIRNEKTTEKNIETQIAAAYFYLKLILTAEEIRT